MSTETIITNEEYWPYGEFTGISHAVGEGIASEEDWGVTP